jgi:hypothetical protein
MKKSDSHQNMNLNGVSVNKLSNASNKNEVKKK